MNKRSPEESRVFLHTLFLENEAQIDRNNYETMLFMSKQVSLPKISSILQKMKIGQNSIYALFAQRPSIGKVIYNVGISVSLLINNSQDQIYRSKNHSDFSRRANYRAKIWGESSSKAGIIIWKIAQIKTIGVTKMRGKFVEISFHAKFLWKATKRQEFRQNSFALLLYNTVFEWIRNILERELSV